MQLFSGMQAEGPLQIMILLICMWGAGGDMRQPAGLRVLCTLCCMGECTAAVCRPQGQHQLSDIRLPLLPAALHRPLQCAEKHQSAVNSSPCRSN